MDNMKAITEAMETLDIAGAMAELGEEFERLQDVGEFAGTQPVQVLDTMVRQSRDVAARAVMHWIMLRASYRGALASGALGDPQEGTH